MAMKRSLVTGGAGFLGSHLCDSLIKDGHSVICLDNLFTGHRGNITHLEANPQFKFVHHDVVDPYEFEVDFIWNLACPAAPGHYRYQPIQTARTSFQGTLNALTLATRIGARILHASTSEVYGDPEVHPQSETYRGNVNPIGPRACYDEGKRVAETLCFDFRRIHHTSIKVIRIFNTYGPRMHPYDGRVVSNFIVQALRGEPLTIYGDGAQTRAFCYVSDMIRGMRLMMDSPENLTGPVNLGNPVEFTVAEIASMIADAVGVGLSIDPRGLPQDDPSRRQPDIELAKSCLHWEPTIAARSGLEQTIAWFRSIDMSKYSPPSPNVMQPEAQKLSG